MALTFDQLLFNRDGNCLAAKLRPGNVHSAEGWEELLLPEIERQQKLSKEVAFRADVSFAKPEIYSALDKANRSRNLSEHHVSSPGQPIPVRSNRA